MDKEGAPGPNLLGPVSIIHRPSGLNHQQVTAAMGLALAIGQASGLRQAVWTNLYLDFARDSRRNDGTRDLFAAGNRVDDLFFFAEPDGTAEVNLLIDEVVLYDAG